MHLKSIENVDRVASLRSTGLLGSPPDETFDRITGLVAKVLRVPVALVSLVDQDHQFFKSCFGLPEPWATLRRTPLSHSFCQEVVEQKKALCISDARLDPMLKDCLAIRDLGVTAYLGLPLTRSDGQTIGALCAIDNKPREWSELDIEVMSDLAGAVIAAIEARQIERAALAAAQDRRVADTKLHLERRLDFILDVMPQLVWTADVAGNVIYFNERWFDYTGLTFEQTKNWGWGAVFHPDDLEPCINLWKTAVSTGEPYQGEFRFKRGSDGQYRWHLNRAHPLHDENGAIVEWIGTSTDIHDHKTAELELLESRSMLEMRVEERTAELLEQKEFVEAVLENISDGIVACGATGALTLFNRATREMHGSDIRSLPPEEWSRHYSLFRPDGVTPLSKEEVPLYRALVENVISDVPIVLGERNGTKLRHVLTNGRAFFDKAGTKLGAVVAMRDVTATRMAERELKDQKHFIEAVLTNVSDGVLACDVNGSITYLNPAIRRMMELDDIPEERPVEWAVNRLALYGTIDHQLLPWNQRPLGRALSGESVTGQEYLIQPKDGGERNIVISSRPMYGSGEAIIGAVATWHDITGFVQQQKQLLLAKETADLHHQELERFQLLVDGAKDYAIYMLSNEGVVETWNTGAVRLKGYLPKEIIGTKFDRFYPDEAIASGKPRRNLEIAREKGKLEEDGWRVRKDGSRFWANDLIEALYDTQGNPIGFSKITRDLTERRAAEQALAKVNDTLRAQATELEQATLAADNANQAKSSFLANMSHEIRTPIAAILGYTDLLLDPKRARSDRFNDLQAIRRNGKHLLELISDVLDLSKIEAGRIEVEKIETNIARLAAEVISMTRPKAIEKELKLKLEFLSPVPRHVSTDPLRLRQILVNLVGNAIKFTEKGEVVVSVKSDGPSDLNTLISFDIRDSGVGMTEEQQSRLFKPFVQADASTTRQFGGTGLGLTISRQLAKLLGGDICVSSKSGHGSTFTITIDVGRSEPEDFITGMTEVLTPSVSPVPRESQKADLTEIRVLLAEDGIDNREILTAYLKAAGAHVRSVENGREAVNAALSAVEKGEPFDVIVMDMQMPVLDGYAATSELRVRGYSGAILALTANAMCDDRAKCISSGCDSYLSKPVERHSFLQTIYCQVAARDLQMKGANVADANPLQTIDLLPANQQTIRSSLAGDPQLSKVVENFIARLPKLINEIQSLFRDGQLSDLRRAAHQLKGAGGSYGLPQLSLAADRLEQSLTTTESLSQTTKDLKELTQLIRSVEGYDIAGEERALRSVQ